MPITRADVLKIAELARLELTNEESEASTAQLGTILDHINKLNELNTDAVEPLSHCTTTSEETEYTRREEVARPGLGAEVATANAPDADTGYFKVPKVINS